jgi:UDP-N-acetylglucosamine 1-carboxyvinyltransferase
MQKKRNKVVAMPADKHDVIRVEGGYPISGDVPIGGAKNSVLKLMAASLMAPGPYRITNVPDISDVKIMSEVIGTLGAKVSFGDHELHIDTTNITSYETPYELVAKMRASISVLGPLIARFGKAKVAMPGGCRIGSRKLDMHIASLEALGVTFESEHGYIDADVKDVLRGTDVTLDFPSVGATENLMMAAVVAEGVTTIENAAREPEICDLANFLNKMGAHIEGMGTSVITIHGTRDLHPVEHHSVVGDRIEAGTFLVAGALGGGPLTVRGVNPANLKRAIAVLCSMGAEVETGVDCITVRREGDFIPCDIQTLPHPGFPTDLQAQFMVMSTIAKGRSIITENVFENRFMFASEITRMGADVHVEGHHAIIEGIERLSGAPVQSSDLRGGAALVLAGLVADGTTVVSEIGHIDRGYEDYVGKLARVGAHVERLTIDAGEFA